MNDLNYAVIRTFLETLGEQYPESARLVLLGDAAMCWLGSPRPTLDLDYVGHDLEKGALQQCIEKIAYDIDPGAMRDHWLDLKKQVDQVQGFQGSS